MQGLWQSPACCAWLRCALRACNNRLSSLIAAVRSETGKPAPQGLEPRRWTPA
ncbi:MAG: hypothetical protein AVDCRST_MAG27-638 [uncultured Craurococcus sp.]|uniref:Uncharacterized protein n=1 Tax=uncultured Craurococcus sp. TaxID=1135998 RepID=A0A6J4HHE2_9PROT|nr:MAG: hypothetical protein AVDCRST_MAG27-638 [uncultured Craurococcus sp.]